MLISGFQMDFVPRDSAHSSRYVLELNIEGVLLMN